MKKVKILSMFIIAVFLIFVFGTRVKALELLENPISNVWYFRKGGNKPAFSAQFKYYEINGKTTYCIEPGEHITTHNYEETDIINSPYSNDINRMLNLIGYYGYDYPNHQTLEYRMATQALIWEVTGGQTVEFWTRPSGAGSFINVTKEKEDIMNLVNNHPDLPTFSNNNIIGYLNDEVKFIDISNNLQFFKILNSNEYDFRIEDNKLIIIPKKIGQIEIKMQRKTYTDDLTTYFVGIDDKSQTMGYFGLSQNDIFSVYVDSKGGTINLKKIDSYNFTSEPRGDAQIEGAIYEVYDENNNEVDRIVIDKDGIGQSKILGLGSYKVKEIQAGEGYSVDTSTHNFTISKTNLNPSKKVTEWAISSTIEIYKVLNDKKTGILTPEKDITFEFYLKRTNKKIGALVTDENGYGNIYLPYGSYIVKQINTTFGYEKTPDFEIIITKPGYIKKVIADGEVNGVRLKVIKKDFDSHNIIKKDGIKFKIKNIDTNEYICQNISYPNNQNICEYETKDGMFITPDFLPYGNYELEELDQIIDGYLWNSEKVKFKIDNNTSYKWEDGLGNIFEINFYNKEVKGSLALIKYGEEMILENNNYYYKNIFLDNINFELYAGSDIYSQDGTLKYKKDSLIKKFKTVNGKSDINNFYLGNYYIKEIKTNDNYNLLESPIYFDINYKDQYTENIIVNIELKNELKKGSFELLKLDLESNEPIGGTIINIYDNKNNLVYSGKTDNKGKILLNNLKIGKYLYYEAEASNGYLIDNSKKYFEIKENGEKIENKIYNKKVDIFKEENSDIPNEEIIDIPQTYDKLYKYISYIIISIIILLKSIVIIKQKKLL